MKYQIHQEQLIGQSTHFLNMLDQVSKIAPLNRPVLIIGERGTGKELIAQRLHFLSNRWQKNLVKLNCAALNETLLESELFGHEAGAYTGAKHKRQGRFELAHNGSLFIDELANTPISVQEKLLGIVEYGEFERLGGNQTLSTNVRLICATNADLPSLVVTQQFRADLLDRLSFDVITLPPLRHRLDDILELANHFAILMASELKWDFFAGFSDNAKTQLLNFSWPGNVRQLKNTIERSLYRQDNPSTPLDSIIFDPFDSPFRPISKAINEVTKNTADELPQEHKHSHAGLKFPLNFKAHCETHEQEILAEALKLAKYNQTLAAELLELSYHQLRGLLKKYCLLDRKH